MQLPKFSAKRIIQIVVSVAVLAIIAVFVITEVRQSHLIKDAEAKAISKIDISIGNAKAQALLVPNSQITKTKTTAASCGADIGQEIDLGNYRIMLIKDLGLGIKKVYTYDMDGLTFVPNQDALWNGKLRTVSLNLTGISGDSIVLYQYQDCLHASATVLNVNPNHGRLEPFQFRGLNNQVNASVVTYSSYLFKSTGKDTMDTAVRGTDPKLPFSIIHWQFLPKDNLFKETGRDSKDKI